MRPPIMVLSNWSRRCPQPRAAAGETLVPTAQPAKTATEVILINGHHVVEELAADGANHAFDEGVLPGRPRCGENLGDADALHPSPELVTVDAVTIPEEVARRRVIGERLDDLLRSPCGRRRIGYVEVHDLAAMMLQDHEHVEHAKGRRRHHEEVDRNGV